VASPAVPVTLIGKLAARRHQAASPGRRVPSLARVAALRSRVSSAAREHGPTFAAFAAIDMGCFQASPVAGWIAAGVSVLFLDWKIRD
jgi:hypothetical protein